MTIREKRQRELAKQWIDGGKRGIIYAAPRFGKIRTSIHIMNAIKPKEILIAYPDNKIRDSWVKDFETMGYDDSGVTYTTHLSMKKHLGVEFDLVIIDEIHLLSEAQTEVAKEVIEINKNVLGLTGTMSSWTENTLCSELDICVVARYSIEQAVAEGVVVDYEITVVRVPLDNVVKQSFKSGVKTEKRQFDSYSYVIANAERQGRSTMFLRLGRMRIIQNSIAKLKKTKELLQKHKDERVLVFCGVTKIADSLDIPSYHSKKEEKEIFDNFVNGKGNHLAVVKIGNTGVTYKPLNRVIINYFDSNAENLAQKINRCMAMEYDNPEKKAKIYIICSTEDVELKWLNKALEFFDKSKIKYI